MGLEKDDAASPPRADLSLLELPVDVVGQPVRPSGRGDAPAASAGRHLALVLRQKLRQ